MWNLYKTSWEVKMLILRIQLCISIGIQVVVWSEGLEITYDIGGWVKTVFGAGLCRNEPG